MDDFVEVRAVGVAHAVNAIALLGTFGLAVRAHLLQPEVVAVHFDLAGVPDRWAHKSWGNTLVLPLTALAITALIYGTAQLAGWARRHPAALNLPDKARFLALPPEAQEPVWRQLKVIGYWLAVPQTLVFLTLAALVPTGGGRLHVWPVFVPLALGLALVPVTAVRLVRRVRQAIAAGGARTAS